MKANLKENLIATAALYVGEFYMAERIDIPPGNEGEDMVADFCVECATDYFDLPDDDETPYCDFVMDRIMKTFKESE